VDPSAAERWRAYIEGKPEVVEKPAVPLVLPETPIPIVPQDGSVSVYFVIPSYDWLLGIISYQSFIDRVRY
jgi:hypothetical protein